MSVAFSCDIKRSNIARSLTALNLHYANANFGPGFCSASFLLQFRPFGQSAACHSRLSILTRVNKCRASGRTKKRKDSASTHRNNSSGGRGGRMTD
ncbi:hypothetical protein niasHS_002819 [Heterodera schachtii]|uniref:Uncharacterized protein n=1 Tax=Heterodera schachtii TaxID=97005 RepID=A0ABD2K341_HETSC